MTGFAISSENKIALSRKKSVIQEISKRYDITENHAEKCLKYHSKIRSFINKSFDSAMVSKDFEKKEGNVSFGIGILKSIVGIFSSTIEKIIGLFKSGAKKYEDYKKQKFFDALLSLTDNCDKKDIADFAKIFSQILTEFRIDHIKNLNDEELEKLIEKDQNSFKTALEKLNEDQIDYKIDTFLDEETKSHNAEIKKISRSIVVDYMSIKDKPHLGVQHHEDSKNHAINNQHYNNIVRDIIKKHDHLEKDKNEDEEDTNHSEEDDNEEEDNENFIRHEPHQNNIIQDIINKHDHKEEYEEEDIKHDDEVTSR